MSSSNNKKSNPGDDDKKAVVAVIGGGVAGLSAAWHLATNVGCRRAVEVHLFESSERLGGHAYATTVETSTTEKATTERIDVDVGFMVFNDQNYPNMCRWFDALNVDVENSDMSLAVSLDKGRTVEWNSDSLDGLFANRRQLLDPDMYRCFVWDAARFHGNAASLLKLHDDDPRKHVTTRQYLQQHGYSEAFCRYYLYPMMAALWSASIEEVYDFPAAQLIGFLCNHRMLQLLGRPQWRTVKGRSKTYTDKVYDALTASSNATVHLSCPVDAVERTSGGDDDNNNKKCKYKIRAAAAGTTKSSEVVLVADHVIFACHPPQARAMLQKGNSNNNVDSSRLLELLDEIRYAPNAVYVHSDPRLMPVRKRAWASWNCIGRKRYISATDRSASADNGDESSATTTTVKRKYSKHESFEGGGSGFGATTTATSAAAAKGGKKKDKHVRYDSKVLEHQESLGSGGDGRMKAVYVTYWLNRLQNLKTSQNVFVSLNPHSAPAPHLTHEKLVMSHPQFTPTTLLARRQLLLDSAQDEKGWQGRDGLWFCGAWAGYGFHEDGCRSGFDVATKLSGVPVPWAGDTKCMVLPPPDLSESKLQPTGAIGRFWNTVTYDWPIAICKRFMYYFLNHAIQAGTLRLKYSDGTVKSFGDATTPCGCDNEPVTLRIFDEWFFVKTALEYDLGLARSYMAGHFVVEPLEDKDAYHPVLRPRSTIRDETTVALGDPIGLTRLFLLLIGNRDRPTGHHHPKKSGQGHYYSNALSNASGLVISKVGSFLNFIRYKLTMDNSEKGGSLKNIHAHYDLSNDVFTSFLDKQTLMYSCAIYDAVRAPPLTNFGSRSIGSGGLVFRGTLEEAQCRKLDTLLSRAQVEQGQTLLDIGFGWGGLSIHAAKKYGCRVTGITLSVEQMELAQQRVDAEGLHDLITFEVVDYRTFARRPENQGRFDRVLSCEMIEAVGHEHLGEFFWAVEQVLNRDGVLVMEAITTPEERYETYRRSTDFINTIIFPGSCCPSLHALVDAAYKNSTLTLEHIDNIGLHYAQTLAEWRRRFNANAPFVRKLGFDDVFLRAWNYYLTYCEAGFFSQTEHCLILVFARQGCRAVAPLSETRSVTQSERLTDAEIENWMAEADVSS